MPDWARSFWKTAAVAGIIVAIAVVGRLLLGSHATREQLVQGAGGGPLAYSTPHPLKLESTNEDREDLELMLDPSSNLSGIVLNESRERVIDGKVQLLRKLTLSECFEARIDESGGFEFRDLPLGDYSAIVHSNGYVVEIQRDRVGVKKGENIPVTFIVRRGWHLTGKVQDPVGLPIEKARIRIDEGGRPYSTATDQEGNFRVEGIMPDTSNAQLTAGIDALECSAERHGTVTKRNLISGQFVTIVLESESRLEVNVSLLEGGPLPDIFQWDLAVTRRGDSTGQVQPRSSEDGAVMTGKRGVLKDLAPGVYDVKVSSLGRQSILYENIYLPPGQTISLQATLIPSQGKREAVPVVLDFDNPVNLRRQLKLIQEHWPLDLAEGLIKNLRDKRDSLPRQSEERKVLEEALREN